MVSSRPRIRVLFVCLGNICRSPAAEGTFRHLVEEQGLQDRFVIDSCGTAAYHTGESPNPRARKVAAECGITLDSRARQFQIQDFDHFDWILAMDKSNYEDILRLTRNAADKKKVRLFRSFDPECNPDFPEDVPDPYYGGIDGFYKVQEILLRTCRSFLDTLQKQGLP